MKSSLTLRLSLAILLLVSAICTFSNGENVTQNFIHFSDIQLDTNYSPLFGPSSFCHLSSDLFKCINDTLPPANSFPTPKPSSSLLLGQYGCFSPLQLLDQTITQLKNSASDSSFILYSGSTASGCAQSEQDTLGAIRSFFDRIKLAFPTTPFYPAIGRYDLFNPSEMCVGPCSYLNKLASLWNKFLNDEQLATFRIGGFYSGMPTEKVRVIVMNTEYYHDFSSISIPSTQISPSNSTSSPATTSSSSFNTTTSDSSSSASLSQTFLTSEEKKKRIAKRIIKKKLVRHIKATLTTDPAGQFEWIKNQLQLAATNSETVYFVGYSPPLKRDLTLLWKQDYLLSFLNILNTTNNASIGGMFFGNTQMDRFNLLFQKGYLSREDEESTAEILAANFQVPSISPNLGGNPTYRIWKHVQSDANSSFSLWDYSQYTLNLGSAQKGQQEWMLDYSFFNLYKVRPTASNMVKLLLTFRGKPSNDASQAYLSRSQSQYVSPKLTYEKNVCSISQLLPDAMEYCFECNYCEYPPLEEERKGGIGFFIIIPIIVVVLIVVGIVAFILRRRFMQPDRSGERLFDE